MIWAAMARPAHPSTDSVTLWGALMRCQAQAERQGSTVNKTDSRPYPEEEDNQRKKTDIKQINKCIMMASQEKDYGDEGDSGG